MSKMEKRAKDHAKRNSYFGYSYDREEGYTQGWKDCLKHDESVKELLEICEMIAEPMNHGFNFEGEVMMIVPDKARLLLKKIKEGMLKNEK